MVQKVIPNMNAEGNTVLSMPMLSVSPSVRLGQDKACHAESRTTLPPTHLLDNSVFCCDRLIFSITDAKHAVSRSK